ncbi:MAG: indolepyruvate oxidoreductase subunit beta [Candidatus Hermodarchaeota archaeon]|jgi:indolepyruvate ferredoxin oxidoreductase beta subunit|nr:indolepyruvate oxidoreductase subunit beta [Candidatus Hermodarchaeota archaeon]
MTHQAEPPLPLNRPLNILVAGVGGQGILLTARIIATAAMNHGLRVSVGETFGASRRGGPVLSHIRCSHLETSTVTNQQSHLTGSLIPLNQADVLVGLEPLESLRAAPYLNPSSRVLLNEQVQPPVNVLANQNAVPTFSIIHQRFSTLVKQLFTVNVLHLAEQAGEIRTTNTVMLGALARLELTPIPASAFEAAIADYFTNATIRAINLKAYQLGFQYFKSIS